ncbi:MAG: saccharopine dehydrogenase family protein [Candidatus Hodarchaeales archaeon]
MGTALCFDLLNSNSNNIVFGFDSDTQKLNSAKEKFLSSSDRFQVHSLNLNVNESLSNHPLISFFSDNEIIVVFGAIDYRYNYYLSRLCIKAKTNFIDLGGNPDVVTRQRSLNKDAKEAKITIIPDLGLAPGMINIISAYGMSKFDKLQKCYIFVGGLPQRPKTSLKYQQVFSIRGLTNEYLEDSFIIRDGRITKASSLSEIETVNFPEPWGNLEAFHTAGGSSSLPELFKGKINELYYKTLRYPGHCQYFRFLKEFDLLSSNPYPKNLSITPRELIEYYLVKTLPKNEPDVVLAKIIITGTINGRNTQHEYQLIDKMDLQNKISAMARTTAFPTSIIGQFIAQERIPSFGVLHSETVIPYSLFLEELKKRNINFDFSEEISDSSKYISHKIQENH